jgi:hypothetical protein
MWIKGAVVLLLVTTVAAQLTHDEKSDDMLGRPDGHEPFQSPTDPLGPSLIGRPDGHDGGVRSDEQDSVNKDTDDNSHETGDDDWDDVDDDHDDSDDDSDDDDVALPNIDYEGYESLGDYDYSDDLLATGNDELPVGGLDEEKPLIRCKRPICLMSCVNGFETDSTGCPVCQCREDAGIAANQTMVIGRPDGHEPASTSCANQALCRMFCSLGFKTDASGCPVCSCLDDPCESVNCRDQAVCEPQPCGDRHPCTQLSAKCIARLPCPEPMCANFCPAGYARNPEGCMTCDCVVVPAEHKCDGEICNEGRVCRNVSSPGLTVPKLTCTVKTLCESMRDKPLGLGAVKPTCEADGSFMSMQCNAPSAECWCVDGSGREVDGTRTTVYVEEHKPKCVRNITVSMHIHMTLIVRHDIDISDHLSVLNSTIVDHVSTWLLIEPHYIRVVKAETSGLNNDEDNSAEADDDENSDEEADDRPKVVIIEIVVLHDGVSDLPSAADYMKRQMHEGRCHIPIGDNSLEPDVGSIQTEHKYAYEPVPLAHANSFNFANSRVMRYGVCATGGLFIVLAIAAVLMAVALRRRRSLTLQFKHQRLSVQTSSSSEKNLLETENDSPGILIAADEKKEKDPIA